MEKRADIEVGALFVCCACVLTKTTAVRSENQNFLLVLINATYEEQQYVDETKIRVNIYFLALPKTFQFPTMLQCASSTIPDVLLERALRPPY